MSKSVDQIVQETLETLKAEFKLSNLANLSDRKRDELREKTLVRIKEIIDHAFQQTEESNHKALYQALYLKLHTDKFKIKYPEVANYFEQLGILDELSKELQTHKEKVDVFSQLGSNPIGSLTAIYQYLQDVLSELLFAYQRYPEPISTFVNVISWIINIALIGAAVVLAVPVGLLLGLVYGVNLLSDLIIQSLSEGRYQEELNLVIADEMIAAKEEFVIQSIEASIAVIEQMEVPNKEEQLKELRAINTFEQLMVRFANTTLQLNGIPLTPDRLAAETQQQTEAVEAQLAAELAPRYHRRVLLNLRAMGNAIAQPLPDGSFGDKTKSVFTKIGQVLSLPFVFIGTCVTELANITTSALTIGSIALLAAIKVASLAILNAPLYIYEGIEYLINKPQESCADESSDEAQNDAQFGAGSSAKLAGLGKGSNPDNANNANVDNHKPLFDADKQPSAAATDAPQPDHMQMD